MNREALGLLGLSEILIGFFGKHKRVFVFKCEKCYTRMAAAGFPSGFSSSQPVIPVFNGEKYEWWSIKVKTLLRSQGL